MISCEKCKTENLEGSQYCDECGALLQGAGAAARAKKIVTGATEEGGGAPPPVMTAESRNFGETRLNMGGTSMFDSNGHPEALSTKAAGAAGAVAAVAADASLNGGPHAKLVIHRGRSVGKEFMMSEDETHIGRWDADGGIFPDVDLDADDPEAKVSRRHARITHRGGQYYIEDLGSTNGTFINRGRRLLPGDRQPLRDGDEVIVGKTFLRFQIIK
jgi:hypothetical protein